MTRAAFTGREISMSCGHRGGAACSGLLQRYTGHSILPEPRFEPSPLAPRRSPEEEARDRDLGFGSVVSRSSQQRLLNRDGSFNVVRTGLGFLESFAPYHLLLTIPWLGFLGVVSATYLV